MLAVFSFVHHAIGTLADALQLLVFIHLLQSREPSVITARARVMWHPNKTTIRPTTGAGCTRTGGVKPIKECGNRDDFDLSLEVETAGSSNGCYFP